MKEESLTKKEIEQKSVKVTNQGLKNEGELVKGESRKYLVKKDIKESKGSIIVERKKTIKDETLPESKSIVGNSKSAYDGLSKKVELDYSYYIAQLKLYYELGNSDGTANLYISSGRENNIRGSEKLRKYYRKAFARTSNRKFDYVINSIRQDKESAVIIEGLFDLSYSSKTLLRRVDKKVNATFVVLLLKVGKEFKIASFDWKEV